MLRRGYMEMLRDEHIAKLESHSIVSINVRTLEKDLKRRRKRERRRMRTTATKPPLRSRSCKMKPLCVRGGGCRETRSAEDRRDDYKNKARVL